MAVYQEDRLRSPVYPAKARILSAEALWCPLHAHRSRDSDTSETEVPPRLRTPVSPPDVAPARTDQERVLHHRRA